MADSPAPPARSSPSSKSRATIWGVVLFVLGIILEAASFVSWGGEKWPAVFVSVGAGALLAGFVMFLEPRLVRDVGRAASKATVELAASTATDVASRVATDRTRELDERLTRVEGIRDIQDRVRSQRRRAATQLAERLRVDVPEYSDVYELLSDAASRRLFGELWLRCGTSPNLLLKIEAGHIQPPLGQAPVWMIFITLGRISIRPLLSAGVREARGGRPDGFVSSAWEPDTPFEVAYEEFVAACERANQSTQNIDFGTAFISLTESYDLMVDSRAGETGDTIRLDGQLILRVNEEWAITHISTDAVSGFHALEGLLSDHRFETWPLVTVDDADDDLCPDGYDPVLWAEALHYAARFLHRTL